MNRYFSYEYDEDFDFNYDEKTFDPYDYPPRQSVDMMDFYHTYHYDGSAKIQYGEDD